MTLWISRHRSFSLEARKLSLILFTLSKHDLKSKIYMKSWCCSSFLWAKTPCWKNLGAEDLITGTGPAEEQPVQFCAWTEGGSVIPENTTNLTLYFISLSLILPSPSWYHFVPPHSAPSLSLSFYACLSSLLLSRTHTLALTHECSAMLRTRTLTQTCTLTGPCTYKCKVISSLIHPAQLWATMRVIRKE